MPSDEQFRIDVFAAVMQEVRNFANGEATIDLDEEEQSEVAVVFQRAIHRVQREHDAADQAEFISSLEKRHEK